MQEKDIREKLNQELEEMAPDMLEKILSKPIEPVKNEKELFGRNKPLFKEKKNIKQYLIAPAMLAVAACLVMAVILMKPLFNVQNNNTKMAFSIIVDVNPSVEIQVNKDGKVDRVVADNKDAQSMIREINGEIKKDYDYNDAMKVVIKNFKKNGYLKKKNSAMLVSLTNEKEDVPKEKLKEIKVATTKVLADKEIKCKTVFQNCRIDGDVKKVAKKNKVSPGKASLCIKLAQKENTSVKKMCKKSIDTLVKKVEEIEKDVNEDWIIDDALPDEPESETNTSEIISDETETNEEETSETENISETATNLIPETVTVVSEETTISDVNQ
ncbi:anti-sigma-I factor RsgI family protein [Eubacterium sp.]